jgi:hypothetical protein
VNLMPRTPRLARALRRTAPALLLLVLAPIVSEFLLGDFTVRRLGLLLVLLPQYGAGALLVREIARRTGRGWPSMLLLAAAYALVEEGFTTQSLFNPGYAGQHLLAYGYVPALGTSLNWSVFVLSIHVVWSISIPILVAEGVAAGRRTDPWLRRPGLAVTGALFVIGCVVTTRFSLASSHFVASVPQLAATAALVAAAIAAAFLLFAPGRRARSTQAPLAPAPPPWLVALTALVLTTVFELVVRTRGSELPAVLNLLGLLACEAVALPLIVRWSRRAGWSPMHALALAPGPLLTYSWGSVSTFVDGHTKLGASAGPGDVAGQVLLSLCLLALVGWAVLRNRSTAANVPAPAVTAGL